MRILYFHQHFSTPTGAAGLRSYRMARKLCERGHHVTMVCGRYGVGKSGLTGEFQRGMRTGTVDAIEVIELDLPYSNSQSFIARIGVFLKYAMRSAMLGLTREYDLVFATSTPLTAGIPGILAKHLRRKPFVFEVRDLWPELPREMGVITNPVVLFAMGVLEWVSYRSADRCIGLSPGIVQGIENRGVDPAKVAMIPNGSDTEIFGDNANTGWRPEGVSPNDLMAVFAGSHGVANGLDSVLDAASALKSKGRSDIKLVFVGDGRLKPDLIKRAEREALTNCIFLDPIPKAQLSGLLSASDVGLMILANVPAFYYGTSPNKFFDYVAAGIPVLNNYPGWLADIIAANQCGIAVAPDNPMALCDSLIDMADMSPESRATMGKSGRNLAVTQFNWNKLSDQFARTIESI